MILSIHLIKKDWTKLWLFRFLGSDDSQTFFRIRHRIRIVSFISHNYEFFYFALPLNRFYSDLLPGSRDFELGWVRLSEEVWSRLHSTDRELRTVSCISAPRCKSNCTPFLIPEDASSFYLKLTIWCQITFFIIFLLNRYYLWFTPKILVHFFHKSVLVTCMHCIARLFIC